MMQPIFIGISGGSGAGKTTLAYELCKYYSVIGSDIIEMDNYYYDLSQTTLNLNRFNFDNPDVIDSNLLYRQLNMLKNGHYIEKPIYDFVNHKREIDYLRLNPKPILIIDGIFILHYFQIKNLMNLNIYVDTPEKVRYNRLEKRDVSERGFSITVFKNQYKRYIYPMHKKYIEPNKVNAELIVNGEDSIQSIITNILETIEVKFSLIKNWAESSVQP